MLVVISYYVWCVYLKIPGLYTNQNTVLFSSNQQQACVNSNLFTYFKGVTLLSWNIYRCHQNTAHCNLLKVKGIYRFHSWYYITVCLNYTITFFIQSCIYILCMEHNKSKLRVVNRSLLGRLWHFPEQCYLNCCSRSVSSTAWYRSRSI